MLDRKRNFIPVLAVILLVGCSSPAAPIIDIPLSEDPALAAAPAEENPLAVFEGNLVKDYQPVLADMGTATRYQIEIEIADSFTDVSGHQDVLYTNNEAVALDEIYFRLFPNVSGPYLTVSDLSVNGEPVQVVLDHQNTAMRVALPVALQPGEQALIAMDFSQSVPSEMGGNYGLYSYLDDILSLDQFFPIIPVYDEKGWHVEDPPINADMVFTDEAFFEVEVDAPQKLVLAGSGVEVASTTEANRQMMKYAGGPQRDFYLAASPLFESASRKVGGTKLTSYFPEAYRDAGMLVLETAVHALTSYNERFGLYPYTELDLISTPMNAGGMEYSGAASLSLYYFNPDHNIGNLTFLESVVAHEIGHQWFFNQVMSDQIEEPWLDEALVQYATYLYYVDRYGENNAQGFVDTWYQRWENVDEAAIPIGKAAGDYTREQYGPIIYGRGPLFFAALEAEMGTENFDQLLKNYMAQYRWGIADGEEFKALAEDACACDLTPLFNEWIY